MASLICQRCGSDRDVKKRSWFDNTTICAKCSVHEKGCPNYQKVHLAGLNALQAGYEPLAPGLSQADIDYLNTTDPRWTPRRDIDDGTHSEQEEADD